MKQLIVIVLMGVCSLVQAQFDQEKWAQEWTESAQYSKALNLWSHMASEAVHQSSEQLRLARKAVFCAKKFGDFESALFWSKRIVEMDAASQDDLRTHMMLMIRLSSVQETLKFLGLAAVRFPENKEVSALSVEFESIRALTKDTLDFSIKRWRPNANGAEFACTPFGAGLVFISSAVGGGAAPLKDGWTGRYFTELKHIENANDPEPKISLLEQLRGEDLFLELGLERTHDGPVAFDQDQNFAVLTRNQPQLDTTVEHGLSRLQLEFFWQREEGWEPANPFPWNSPEYSCGHATFDENEDIIFASDIPGGFGGMDLYSSRWEDDDWSKPENLGPEVNSSGNELFPMVSAAGNLYFASDGWPGAGGLDVFVHPIGSDQIERLGFPINGQADDFAFNFDEAIGEGWLSSNRSGGNDAIYRVEGSPTVGQIMVSVMACDGSSIAEAKMLLKEVNSGLTRSLTSDVNGECSIYGWLGRDYDLTLQPFKGMNSPPSKRLLLDQEQLEVTLDMSFASKENSIVILDEERRPAASALLKFRNADGETSQFVTDENGQFQWSAASQAEDFVSMTATLINYEDLSHEFAPPPPGCLISICDTLQLAPWNETLERIDLANILYDLGSAALRNESKKELDKLVAYMKDKPEIRVELSSHTDCRNDEAYNLQLSQARAEKCVNYIINKGISKRRIVAKGYGESQLLNGCSDVKTCGCAPLNVRQCIPCNEDQHQANRRTELRLLAD